MNCNIVEKVRLGGNSLWKEFIIVDKYYHENDFRYKIFDNDNFIIYQEFLNNGKINEIEIDKSSLDYFILERANSEVILLTDLLRIVNQNETFNCMLECEILSIIENLRGEGLLYVSSNYSELLTVIDIKEVV